MEGHHVARFSLKDKTVLITNSVIAITSGSKCWVWPIKLLSLSMKDILCVFEDLKINKLDDEWTRKYSTTWSY